MGAGCAVVATDVPGCRDLIEHDRTEDLFLKPKDERTAAYIEGRYG